MNWLKALTAIAQALPDLVALLRFLAERSKEIDFRALEKRSLEIREAQKNLELDLIKVVNDEDRAALARRLSELERRK